MGSEKNLFVSYTGLDYDEDGNCIWTGHGTIVLGNRGAPTDLADLLRVQEACNDQVRNHRESHRAMAIIVFWGEMG